MYSTDFYGFLHCIGNYASYMIPLGMLPLLSGIANVYLSAKLAFRGHGASDADKRLSILFKRKEYENNFSIVEFHYKLNFQFAQLLLAVHS